MSKTILITGVSSGLGLAIAEAAFEAGHVVIGTVRHEDARRSFEQKAPGRSFARLLDVTEISAIAPLVQDVEERHGPIDVLVNNAGYGLRGVMEEVAIVDLRRQFEVNVFAPVALIQAVLPGMRAHRHGHVINVASMGSVVTFPGLGAYHASKFALLGIGDTLAQELEPLGIHVTSIMPGLYRSDWSGRSLAEAQHTIADYDWVFEHHPDLRWGDPAALGRVVAQIIDAAVPPRRLLVGPTALEMVGRKMSELQGEMQSYETLSHASGEG